MLRAFQFRTTKSILCEVGGSSKLGSLLKAPDIGATKVLIVTDPGIVKSGICTAVVNKLKSSNPEFALEIYDDVVADPPEDRVIKAVTHAKAFKADAIVGLGGGSAMDVAKLVALLASEKCKNESIASLYGVENCAGARLPLIQIPTTAGTGSEVTPISIITTGKAAKKGVVSSLLLPDWAILDAELTVSVPLHVTAATGVDAMVHALEAYTSRVKKNVMSDLFAVEAMKLLSGSIKEACFNGSNLVARQNMLLGACYAGIAFANAPVGAVHALAYPIGAQFHVPHGLSNALVLPHVIRFNLVESSASKQYREVVGTLFPGKTTPEELADEFQKLSAELQLERNLRAVGIQASDIPSLAAGAMEQTRLLPNNPREVRLQDVIDIYTAAL